MGTFTVGNVLTMAQRELIDIDDDAYLDSNSQPMLSFFNEACRRFATETHCCQKAVAITATAQTITYANLVTTIGNTARSVLWIIKVQFNTGTQYYPIHKAPMSEMKQLLVAATVIPTRWSDFADAIRFDTHPDTVLSLATIVFCSFVPEDRTATSDTMIIPDEWAMAIVKYIVYCCRIADRDFSAANGAFSDYENIRVQAAKTVISRIEGLVGI